MAYNWQNNHTLNYASFLKFGGDTLVSMERVTFGGDKFTSTGRGVTIARGNKNPGGGSRMRDVGLLMKFNLWTQRMSTRYQTSVAVRLFVITLSMYKRKSMAFRYYWIKNMT